MKKKLTINTDRIYRVMKFYEIHKTVKVLKGRIYESTTMYIRDYVSRVYAWGQR